ncbi:MAG: CRTAC1 family protein [Devosia nanyangense]|uniref:CRTAC1 family protein n=1 Tax=Devosia nanyangense TaxID=1228055 RepID=A0A933L377_9HYPH|nr:CRTAC1 family protein [Devosia nanyangense]
MRDTSPRLAAITLAFAGLAQAATAQAQVVPTFVDETANAGIDSVYAGEWQYMVGGGVATFDCSGDGFLDMLLAGGEAPAKFYLNQSTQGGALKFAEVTSGLELDAVTGAYPLDIDSDGIEDVVLLRVGESVAMRGLGACRFERANEAWGFNGGDAWWTAFAATWERGATWPTLALGSYIDRSQEIEPWGSCTDNWLERPRADGKGFDAPVPLRPSYCALSMLFTDWNRSGTPGLRIANDREYYRGGQEQLWRLDAGQPPALYTDKDGWKNLRIWGMGIASADVTGDGYPDYFVTSMADNKLQTLASATPDSPLKADYKDIAFPRGVIAQRPYTGGDVRPSTAWHAQFEDVNNDGLMDLFIAKGNVDQMPDFAANDPNNLLLQSTDGKFTEVGEAAGIASMGVSRGAEVTDFNLDGLLDLVVVHRRQAAQLWRNTTPDPRHWIELRLQQPGVNRDAIGAAVEVRIGSTVTRREITLGGGHVSGQIGWWHFGLGDAAAVDIRVTWPDGTAGEWLPLAAGSFYVLERDRAARVWLPG